MLTFKIKPLFIAIGLGCLSVNSWAQVSSNKTVVNSINGDNITATVSFPAPVTGDLYVAADIGGGTLLFIGKGATFSTTPAAFQSNGNFTTDLTVLDIPTAGIPAGVYPLYQVVTKAGSNPLDFNNWIGGFGGLSNITFTINLANTVHTPDPLPIVTTTPTPAPVVTPIPALPTPTPVVINVAAGKALYTSLGCSGGGCHTANPTANKNRVLLGNSISSLKVAIQKYPRRLSENRTFNLKGTIYSV